MSAAKRKQGHAQKLFILYFFYKLNHKPLINPNLCIFALMIHKYLLLYLCSTFLGLYAQMHTYNGWTIMPKDTIYVWVIFAQIDNLPNYDNPYWKVNELPHYAHWLLDQEPNQNKAAHNFTQFFKEMSLGRLCILGETYPELVRVQKPQNISSFYELNGIVVDSINQRLKKPNPPKIHFEKMDKWRNGSPYLPKQKEQDNVIDFVFFIYRNGEHTKFIGAQGGVVSTCARSISGKQFGNGFTLANGISENYPRMLLTHEFGHNLLGDNTYHSAGGAHSWNDARGEYNFRFTSTSGWGLLGALCSDVFNCINAWDRWRLGWLGNFYDLDKTKGTQIITLRDFVTTGDALRIKLPNIPVQNHNDILQGIQDQYLWLENHQKISLFDQKNFEPLYCNDVGNFKFVDNLKKGIYIFQQIGRNSLSDPNAQPTEDYIRFLSAEGNFDYKLGNIRRFCYGQEPHVLIPDQPNPLTGFNDLDKQKHEIDGVLKLCPVYIKQVNGIDTVIWAQRGDERDAWQEGDRIAIDTNPSTASFARYYLPYAKCVERNYIYLNGLSIKVLKQHENGDITLEVRFDDFDIRNDVRWCGKIVSTEQIHVLPRKTLLLDKGRSPLCGVKIQESNDYVPLTELHLNSGSFTILERNSKILLRNQSVLYIHAGAKVILNQGKIFADGQSEIIVEKGAEIIINKVQKNIVGRVKKIE
ncbi:MAG: hypothetical protein NZ455_05820 [Bacteroidia bacterium]|nr:hypothetical protein [Bacteroidia bacterium]MDW8348381.1 hypothetical protein [Bacteroidia bacterium]